MFTYISAACAAINTSIKLAQGTFELHAVGERTTQLLKLSETVDGFLQHARIMRRQNETSLTSSDKAWMDGILSMAEKAIQRVIILIESARIDHEISGKISLRTRVVFVLRDSPEVIEILAMLNIQNTNLNTMVSALYTIQATAAIHHTTCTPSFSSSSAVKPANAKPPPPTYEQSQRHDPELPHVQAGSHELQCSQGTIEQTSPSSALVSSVSSQTSSFAWTEDMSGLQVYEIPSTGPCMAQRALSHQAQRGTDSTSIEQDCGLHVCDDGEFPQEAQLPIPTSSLRHSASNIEQASILRHTVKGSRSLRGRLWLAHQAGDLEAKP